MSEYRAIYKCRLCGGEFEGMIFEENDNSPFYAMVNFLAGNDSFEMGYREPPNIIYKSEQHNCKDGSYGFADFIGFRKVEDNDEPDRKMEKP